MKSTTFLKIAQAAAIIVLGALIYSNTLRSPYALDDGDKIIENYAIRSFDYFIHPSKINDLDVMQDTKQIFFNRYLCYLSFFANIKLGAFSPTGYHLVNISIHIISALCVFVLTGLILRTPYFTGAEVEKNRFVPLIPFLAGLLFVAHPIANTAVTYIWQRGASMVTMFYLCATIFYVRSRLSVSVAGIRGNYALAVFFALAGVFTKENIALLPFTTALLEFTLFTGHVRKRVIRLIPLLAIMFLIPANMLMARLFFGMPDSMSIDRWDYFFTQPGVVSMYLRLLLLPINQKFDYDIKIVSSFFSLDSFPYFCFLVSVFALGVYLFIRGRKRKSVITLAALGILWFFITISLESSVIPLAEELAWEYRAYLPSVGFFWLYVVIVAIVADKVSEHSRIVGNTLIGAFVAIILMYALAAYARNEIWRSLYTLEVDIAEKSPMKYRTRLNLGAFYFNMKLYKLAEAEYLKAREIKSSAIDSTTSLGNLYLKMGDYEKAYQSFLRAKTMNPKNEFAYFGLAEAFVNRGKNADALEEFKKSIAANPKFADAHKRAGDIYYELGRTDEARRSYETALKLKPVYVETLLSLGILYGATGQPEKAIEYYDKALALEPGLGNAHVNKGMIHAAAGQLDLAEAEYQKALEIYAKNASAHNNLGKLYAMRGDLAKAEQEFEAALAIDPASSASRENLAMVRALSQK